MNLSFVRILSVSGLALAAALSLSAGSSDAAPRKKAPAAVRTLPWAETAATLRDRALAGSIAYSLVEDITTRFGPRPAGSAAEARAAAWGAEKLKALGFSNVAVETFPLVPWTRISESGAIVAPYPQNLTVSLLGGSASTPPEGIEADAVVFETFQALQDAAPGSLTGKIAVVLQPTVRVQDGSGYGFASTIRSQGPSVAASKGAVAFVMRALGTHDHRFANTGSTRRSPAAVPGFSVSPPDAMQMARAARAGTLRLRLNGQAVVPANGQSQNVVAEIRGRERPEEVIVIGGHLDSWDMGTGAIDDAAGVAITTAAAKLIADLPVRPRRTIRVVWFGSEELSQPDPDPGLQGGRNYAERRKSVLVSHVIASESDFGAGRVYSLSLPAGWQSGEFQRTVMRLLAPIGLTFDTRPSTSGGPDVSPLAPLGVPSFRLNQDGSDYFDYHHTADDVLERVDARKLDQNVAAWAVMLWLIADSDVDFRKPAPDATPPAK